MQEVLGVLLRSVREHTEHLDILDDLFDDWCTNSSDHATEDSVEDNKKIDETVIKSNDFTTITVVNILTTAIQRETMAITASATDIPMMASTEKIPNGKEKQKEIPHSTKRETNHDEGYQLSAVYGRMVIILLSLILVLLLILVCQTHWYLCEAKKGKVHSHPAKPLLDREIFYPPQCQVSSNGGQSRSSLTTVG